MVGMSGDYTALPEGLPVPHDDGAADGLVVLAEFELLGATLVGISAQSAAEQAEFAAREHIPFPLLSDDGLRLGAALGLPTFEVEGRTFFKRLTFVAVEARIVKVFYPVFPPDRDAGEVPAWLRGHAEEGGR
jgi:peroxiredoxin